MARWQAEPRTTPAARPAVPITGYRRSAPVMIPRLYMIGASTEAANLPRAFRTLVATVPMARTTGLRTMILVSPMVRSILSGSKPGAVKGTSAGAARNRPTASTSSATSIRLATVDTTCQARSSVSRWRISAITGMSAELRAPAATSWNIRSGRRKAAWKASASGPIPRLPAMIATRTQPSTRDARNAPETSSPARARPRRFDVMEGRQAGLADAPADTHRGDASERRACRSG